MNCLNTVGATLFAKTETPLVITITGTGTYTPLPTSSPYIIKFTNGTNSISINKNIKLLSAIVVGGGGGGSYGGSRNSGAGGGGGGLGVWEISYNANAIFNISVSGADVAQNETGASNSFKNASGLGVTSTGGVKGNGSGAGSAGSSSNSSSIGTFRYTTGGAGGAGTSNFLTQNKGNDSSGTITTQDVIYRYGGGGAAGVSLRVTGTAVGGAAGLDGIGGTTLSSTAAGNDATSNGSGGGGGAFFTSSTAGGKGKAGIVIVVFTYP